MKNLFVTCFDNVSSLPDQVDAIFVVNQEISPEQIKFEVDGRQIERLIIISTHAPFPDEQQNVKILLPTTTTLWWIPMSWLLSDSEMESCDDRAVDELTVNSERLDLSAFFRRSRFLRNEQAAFCLAKHVRWDLCYAAEGIGVVRKAWPNAIPLGMEPPQPKQFQYSLFRRSIACFKRLCCKPEIQIIEDESESYVFLGHTNRLRFRHGVSIRTLKPSLSQWLRMDSDITILKRLVSRATATPEGKIFMVSTTVHNFSPWMLEAFPDLRVFVDGLHPPNYPISYGAGYRGALVVSRDDCDQQWFEKCGCAVLPPPLILEQECNYGDPCRPRPIHNICLMLNHAGDWSALIDRSDTDFVVMTFVEAAAKLPQFTFRVRPHPTMAMIEHEGVGSYERLRNCLMRHKLSNLEFSNLSFEEDLVWTDCCVSEYSNVLVDCMKADKACVALNPTNRRNFMQHLEPLGLRVVHDSSQLVDFLVGLTT